MDIMSMTGFGEQAFSVGGRVYGVTIKSVNHRNLSLRVNLPNELQRFEAQVRAATQRGLERGAIDVSVRLDAATADAHEVRIDRQAGEALMIALQDLATHCGTTSPTLDQILRYGDIVHVQPRALDEAAARVAIAEGVEGAIAQVAAMRAIEGEALAKDMLERLAVLTTLIDTVEEAAPAVLTAMETRLRERLDKAQQRLGIELDESRLASELVIFSDRADVTEETVRARAHVQRFQDVIADSAGAARGKQLDFLAQELLRELNTMGSKCRDTVVTQAVVDAKVELEKVREQIQNIL